LHENVVRWQQRDLDVALCSPDRAHCQAWSHLDKALSPARAMNYPDHEFDIDDCFVEL
jgi:hypothetical protein